MQLVVGAGRGGGSRWASGLTVTRCTCRLCSQGRGWSHSRLAQGPASPMGNTWSPLSSSEDAEEVASNALGSQTCPGHRGHVPVWEGLQGRVCPRGLEPGAEHAGGRLIGSLSVGSQPPLPGIEQVPEAAGCRAARGRVPQCDQGCRPGPRGRLGQPLVCGPGVRLHAVLGLPCLPRGTTASQQRLRGPQSSVCPTEEFLGLLQTGRQRTRVCLLTQAHTGGAGSGGKAARAPPCCYGDKAVPVL